MQFSRNRIAALGASAILILAGASVAFAQKPSAQPVAPDQGVEDPSGAPDLDNIQEGDQTGPDEAGAGNGVEDPADAPETDYIEEGDHTAPDTSAQAAPLANQAPVAQAAAKVKQPAAGAKQAAIGTKSETSAESDSSAESDGPGGHQDVGDNADHQFEGEE